jgi:tetratricopeptide (TPR) repeat protein
LLERSVSLCNELGLPTYAHWIAPALGAAYALTGRADEAVALLEQTIEQGAASSIFSQHSLTVALLGEALLLAGREQEALARATEALGLSRLRNEPGYQAWALRLLGEIAGLRHPSDAQAEASYEEALRLADELGMRPLAAHCHLGLGALGRRTGTFEQARTHVTDARSMYHEMDMRFWLDQADVELAKTK